jgi:hypothetical protein
MRQRLAEKWGEPDEVVSIGAIAVKENNELVGRATGGGRTRRSGEQGRHGASLSLAGSTESIAAHNLKR